jgi:hypothetical protein
MMKASTNQFRNRTSQAVGAAIVILAGFLAFTMPGVNREKGRMVLGEAQAASKPDDLVARGKYLVTAFGCNDCHTPLKMGPKGPEPDMSRMLSGHPADLTMPQAPLPTPPWGWIGAATNTAFLGPWGTSFASNLTSDEETGIGAWDDQLFIKTMRGGKFMGGGRPLLPPMPWQGYGQLTDNDLKAVIAFLHSLPPMKNKVPDYVPPPGESGRGPR